MDHVGGEKGKRGRLIALLAAGGLGAALPSPAEGKETPAALFQKGLYLETGAGDLSGAITPYERIVSEFPEAEPFAAWALVRMGLIEEMRGNPLLAIELYGRVRERYIDRGEVVAVADRRLAHLYYRLSREKARPSAEEQTPAQFLSHHTMKGMIHARQGEYEKAKEEYAKALLVDPDYAPSLTQIAYLSQRIGEYEEAARFYRRAAKSPMYRTSFHLHSNLAYCYEELGEEEAAMAVWADYIKTPGVRDADRVDAEVRLNAYHQEEALQEAPLTSEERETIRKANRLVIQRKYGDALNVFLEMLQAVPKNSYMHARTAYVHEKMKNLPQAAEHYVLAVQYSQSTSNTQRHLLNLSGIYEEMGQNGKAIQTLEEYFRNLGGHTPELVETYVQLRQKAEKEKSSKAWQRLRRLKDRKGPERGPKQP